MKNPAKFIDRHYQDISLFEDEYQKFAFNCAAQLATVNALHNIAKEIKALRLALRPVPSDKKVVTQSDPPTVMKKPKTSKRFKN